MAILHDRVATATIKGTTFLCHENALQAFFYSSTNHRNHPLSILCHFMILSIGSKNFGVFTSAF
jgi:hypothetical protein